MTKESLEDIERCLRIDELIEQLKERNKPYPRTCGALVSPERRSEMIADLEKQLGYENPEVERVRTIAGDAWCKAYNNQVQIPVAGFNAAINAVIAYYDEIAERSATLMKRQRLTIEHQRGMINDLSEVINTRLKGD